MPPVHAVIQKDAENTRVSQRSQFGSCVRACLEQSHAVRDGVGERINKRVENEAVPNSYGIGTALTARKSGGTTPPLKITAVENNS